MTLMKICFWKSFSSGRGRGGGGDVVSLARDSLEIFRLSYLEQFSCL